MYSGSICCQKSVKLSVPLAPTRVGRRFSPPQILRPIKLVNFKKQQSNLQSRVCSKNQVICSASVNIEQDTRLLDFQTVRQKSLEQHPKLVRGQLKNGLQYVILPNKKPKDRFEAHLEVHVGSVNELDNEQGLAHLVEHVRFLGSTKRENLLDLGTKSNAFTDFHHTVYHVHSPVINPRTSGEMLQQVLEALAQVGFEDKFSSKRIAKERKAILAEAQMMNTIEYRMDCELLKQLHSENALGRRFPIGMVEQVEQWGEDLIKDFWQRWYQPSNATLYIVGDFSDTDKVQEIIAESFLPQPKVEQNGNGLQNGNGEEPISQSSKDSDSVLKYTEWLEDAAHGHRNRMPPVDHVMGVEQKVASQILDKPPSVVNFKQMNGSDPSLQIGQNNSIENFQFSTTFSDQQEPCRVEVFRHPLVPLFTMSVMAKTPIMPMSDYQDIVEFTKIQLICMIFAFRVNKRYLEGGKQFAGIDLDISNSAREACAVSTVTISAEAKDWQGAIEVAVEEARGMQKYGVTQAEFDAYLGAILKQTEVATQIEDAVESKELLEFLMDAIAMKHTFITNKSNRDIMQEIAPTLTLPELKAACRSHLSFMSHYGREEELWKEYIQDPTQFGFMGPTKATTITVCQPAFVDESGHKLPGSGSVNRGQGMSTGQHIDAEGLDMEEVVKELKAQKTEEQEEYFQAPEGAIKFNVQSEDIVEALKGINLSEPQFENLVIPEQIVSKDELQKLFEEANPTFVPPARSTDQNPFPPPEEETGIIQRKISNGVCINYKYSDSEKSMASLRINIPGGNLCDPVGKKGLTQVAVNCIREVARFGDWSRSEFEMFCAQKMIQITALESDHECTIVDMNFWAQQDNFQHVAGLLFQLLTRMQITQEAFDRAKVILESSIRVLSTSLEEQTDQMVLGMMFGGDRRMVEMKTEDLQNISLEDVQQHMQKMFFPNNLEISVVGDIDVKVVEEGILKYLGCIQPPSTDQPLELDLKPLVLKQTRQFGDSINIWHQKDQEERALARVCGKSFSAWGPWDLKQEMKPLTGTITPPQLQTPSADPASYEISKLIRQSHPFFTHATQYLLQQVLNSRLFMVVRDQLNLSYDIKFEFKSLNQVRGGYYMVNVTSTAAKIRKTTEASIDVLHSLKQHPISWMELDRARQSILQRHKADCENHQYLLGLLQYLQTESVPYKTVECLRDLEKVYQCILVQDLNEALQHIGIQDFFVCIATSGPQQPEDLAELKQPPQAPQKNQMDSLDLLKNMDMNKLAQDFVRIVQSIQRM